MLVALLGCFRNNDASVFTNGRLEGEGDQRTLVVPGGVGADIRLHGRIAGSPLDADGSGFVRVRQVLRTLHRNEWIEVEQSVAELKITLGERARKPNEGSVG